MVHSSGKTYNSNIMDFIVVLKSLLELMDFISTGISFHILGSWWTDWHSVNLVLGLLRNKIYVWESVILGLCIKYDLKDIGNWSWNQSWTSKFEWKLYNSVKLRMLHSRKRGCVWEVYLLLDMILIIFKEWKLSG